MKIGLKNNLEDLVMENKNYRKVLYTAENIQLIMMSLPAKTDIGLETHEDTDQFFKFESGTGQVIIDDAEYVVNGGDGVIVPAGCEHNIINTSEDEDLKLYTIYSPPHHKDKLVDRNKEDEFEEEFDGILTE